MRRQLFQYPPGGETRRWCAMKQARLVTQVPANVDAAR
jgi:hypothetical protein